MFRLTAGFRPGPDQGSGSAYALYPGGNRPLPELPRMTFAYSSPLCDQHNSDPPRSTLAEQVGVHLRLATLLERVAEELMAEPATQESDDNEGNQGEDLSERQLNATSRTRGELLRSSLLSLRNIVFSRWD